jgi:hypothetical protein
MVGSSHARHPLIRFDKIMTECGKCEAVEAGELYTVTVRRQSSWLEGIDSRSDTKDIFIDER